MLTLDDIAALESLWADANQDTPWQTYEAKDGTEGVIHLCDDDGAPLAWLPADDAGRCNGRLIVTAVNALPALLALARRGLEADARPDLSTPAEAPEGTNPLDTPEAREAMFEHMMRVVEAWPDAPEDAEEEAAAKRQMTGAVLDALAPHVAAAQRAAFRAGVEAAAGVCRTKAKRVREANKGRRKGEVSQVGEYAAGEVNGCANLIAALPVPAAFAAPEPDGWLPIETAPRDGTPFLAALSNGDGALLWAPHGLQRASPRYLWWCGTATWPDLPVVDTHPPGMAFEIVATHWRPFPALPRAAASEAAP